MQRTRLHALVLLAMLAVAGASVNVSAQPSATSGTRSAEALKRADAAFRSGNKLYTEKNWAEAETAFLAAWELNPTYDVAANLGHTQYRLGKYREAAEHLTFALRNWPLIGAPEPRKLAEDRLAEVRALVASLTIEAKAEHAEVYVDGKLVGRTPLDHEVFVDPGSRKVEAKHDLYGTETVVVNAEKGSTQAVKLTLGLKAPPAPPASASAAPSSAPPSLSGSGAPPPPPPKRSPVPAIVVGGLAVGAAAVGVGLLVGANGKVQNLKELDGQLFAAGKNCFVTPTDSSCVKLYGIGRDVDTFRYAAVGMFIGASVMAAGALTYIFWPAPKTKTAARVHAAPAFSERHGAMVIWGAF